MKDREVQVVPVVFNNGISLDQNNGTYKEQQITYEFVPQAFTKAYIKAWEEEIIAKGTGTKAKPVFLVIEEINRGNCAQIFGDLFQLLDRDDEGVSEYPIKPDTDLERYINDHIKYDGEEEELKAIASGTEMKLPENLYIWATMNTSDQSLFPIDSAFKRRWDWKYVPIRKGKDTKTGMELDWKIDIGGSKYDWWDFLEKTNKLIASDPSIGEDKQMGYFFCKAKDDVIDEETFVNKVCFYLWNDVFKDFMPSHEALRLKKGEEERALRFTDFFEDNRTQTLQQMLDRLGVKNDTNSAKTEEGETEE